MDVMGGMLDLVSLTGALRALMADRKRPGSYEACRGRSASPTSNFSSGYGGGFRRRINNV